MNPSDLFLIILGLVTLVPAFFVAFSRNLIYSAFSLLFTFLGVAGLYGFLAADFLAVLQLMIYVGGILVLVIFGVLFTQKIYTPTIIMEVRTSLPGLIIGTVLCIALFLFIGIGLTWEAAEPRAAEPTIHGLGEMLLTKHLLPFEIASVLLLTVMIGAVAIARKELE